MIIHQDKIIKMNVIKYDKLDNYAQMLNAITQKILMREVQERK
ncbi:hypothetical protein MY1_1088 [Nitrosarchaeum koreense MY1]|uniref:Uncharacterized protein n=1 Tax=Nitrosarchaeum koreense MY1 TaxID=1001994 RepID=F9CX46_9ARCH|nr:hypothetical protein MY1_1088 [Nitrosarchaeum koreense MY1]